MSTLTAVDEADALEQLHRLGCTDGLPVVIPTPERVARCVLATGADPTTSLGVMGPLSALTTIERVATNAVMAGCDPDHMPIVVATLRALLRPEYDLSEAQSTTHSTAPLIVVSGPLASACGIAGGFGALGPGHRANATIGRAVRLCLINIGGARPGASDMALLGQPGKFTMCITENSAESPWEPCSVAAGFDPFESVVTVIGVEGPHSVVFVDDADDPDSALRLLRVLARAIANPGSNNAFMRTGSVAVAINPDHAAVLARAGLGRADVQRELHRLATNLRGDLRELNPAFAGSGDAGDELHALPSPDHVLVLVAGGGGLYSTVFPSWSAGAHLNPILHERIEADQACEVPASG
ncbi:MAG: hypothetical protein JWM12_3633 [Ilumatobacteraceae bacterium]|nr:hypothetical protein [Ilumatobacteraceae bacterium]